MVPRLDCVGPLRMVVHDNMQQIHNLVTLCSSALVPLNIFIKFLEKMPCKYFIFNCVFTYNFLGQRYPGSMSVMGWAEHLCRQESPLPPLRSL